MRFLSDPFLELFIEKAKVWGLFFMLILVPISYTNGTSRPFQENMFVISAMTYASLYFGSVWITLFFIQNILLFIWNGSQVGNSQIMNILVACLIFAASRSLFSKRPINVLINAFKIILILDVLWMTMQLFGIDPLFLGVDHWGKTFWGVSFRNPMGLFNLPAMNGQFLSLCIPFMFTTGWLIPLLICIPVALTSSAAAYISTATMIIYGIFYIGVITFKRTIYYWLLFSIIALAGIGGLIYDYQHDKKTGGSRFESWHMIFKMGLAKPFFGYGPDSFRNYTPSKNFLFITDEDYNPILFQKMSDGKSLVHYYSADEGERIKRFKGREPKALNKWEEAHNEYIEVFFEYGLLGIFLIGSFIYEIFHRWKLSVDSKEVRVLGGSILCYLILCTTQFPFHLARIALFLPVILGAFFALTDKDWDTFVRGGKYVG